RSFKSYVNSVAETSFPHLRNITTLKCLLSGLEIKKNIPSQLNLKALNFSTALSAINVNVLFHQELSYKPHFKTVTKTCFLKLRTIFKQKLFLSGSDIEKLVMPSLPAGLTTETPCFLTFLLTSSCPFHSSRMLQPGLSPAPGSATIFFQFSTVITNFLLHIDLTKILILTYKVLKGLNLNGQSPLQPEAKLHPVFRGHQFPGSP
ncbi:hypothetical protein Z043_106957, partial [Scleropages formosus]